MERVKGGGVVNGWMAEWIQYNYNTISNDNFPSELFSAML